MTDQKALSDRIEMYCVKQKISYYVLAARSGVPITTILNILNGETKNPGIFTIDRICDGLSVSMKEFFSCESFSRKGKPHISRVRQKRKKKSTSSVKSQARIQNE